MDHVLGKLKGVVKRGAGYTALCPAHADKKPSLSVGKAENGAVLLHCHAGCSLEHVLSSINLSVKDLFNQPSKQSRIAALYDYRSESGVLLFQVVRLANKGFYQRRPNGSGWIDNLGHTRRVVYRLPELLASDELEPVFICEGEKDVDNVRKLGCAATCNPGGAGKWRKAYSDFFYERICVILPDNDKPGQQHATDVALSLLGKAKSVSILRLPELSPKGDVSDWIAKSNVRDDLLALTDGADIITCQEDLLKSDNTPIVDLNINEPSNKNNRHRHKNETQAGKLIKLVEGTELFHNAAGDGFATVNVNSHKETYPIRSKGFREWISMEYWRSSRSVPSINGLQDALNGLSGLARYEGKTRSVNLRVAEFENNIYIDLGDAKWQTVEITPKGWQVLIESPVKFRRTRGTLPLPMPEKGTPADLKPFINIAEDDWPLLLSWLVTVFRPSKPFPVLVLHGEQGTGKSTTAKALRALIDPNISPLRSVPKDERDLMIAANNSWLLSLDNLSSMPTVLSDALCRLSTGGGFSTRELFTDGDEILMDVMRPVMVNGIDEVISRSDLVDRSLLLRLPRLSRRVDESTFWKEFESARPKALGAILDGLSTALSRIEQVTLEAHSSEIELPRLADFALWGIAAEPAFSNTGSFAQLYNMNREAAHDLIIGCNPFAEAVIDFMASRPFWQGKPSDFIAEILKVTSEAVARQRGFPKSSTVVGRRLSEIAPNLRRFGIEYEPPDRKSHSREMWLRNVDHKE